MRDKGFISQGRETKQALWVIYQGSAMDIDA